MAPTWNKLMDEFDGDATKLIADVDCTAAGKSLCEANGVRGYPTLKYGDPSDLQDYKGGRDMKDLKKHVETKLVAMCSPANIDLCDDAKKAEIEKFSGMSNEELEKQIAEKTAEMEAAEKEFKKGVEALQATYEKLQEEKEATLEAIKDSGLGLMKSVLKNKGKEAAKDEL
jgi:hypothetical protein